MKTSTSFRMLRIACPVIVVAILAAGSAAANLIENPSFELGPEPGEAMLLEVGSTAITGWVVTRNAIDYCGTRWEHAQGQRSLGLNGANPGGVAQTFATAPGEGYDVSFLIAGDSFSTPALKHLRVTAAGQSEDYEFDITHSWPWGMAWIAKTFSFTANSGSTTLEFYSLDTGDTGPALDSVVVDGPPANVPPGDEGSLALESPYPNPAPIACSIAFTVPAESPVRLSVIDMQGREISVLAHRTYAPGRHVVPWSGEVAGGRARAGIYFIRFASLGTTLVRKAVITP